MNSTIVDVLTNELGSITWNLVCVIILAGIAGFIFKLIEKKILEFVSNKASERKQKKLDELTASKETKITRNEPTYEEWKANRLAAEKEEHPEQ